MKQLQWLPAGSVAAVQAVVYIKAELVAAVIGSSRGDSN